MILKWLSMLSHEIFDVHNHYYRKALTFHEFCVFKKFSKVSLQKIKFSLKRVWHVSVCQWKMAVWNDCGKWIFAKIFLTMDVPSETNLRNLYPRNIHVSAIRYAIFNKGQTRQLLWPCLWRGRQTTRAWHTNMTHPMLTREKLRCNNIHLEIDTCAK